MKLPDSNDDATSSIYNVQIGQGIVIDEQQHMVHHFHDTPSDPQVNLAAAEVTYRQQVVDAYTWLSFSGFDRSDLSLVNVPLEDIFVRLTLTVEKVIREPMPLEQSSHTERVIIVQQPIELSQALSNHLLIVGEPGAGKSTLLRWLAVIFAQGHQR